MAPAVRHGGAGGKRRLLGPARRPGPAAASEQAAAGKPPRAVGLPVEIAQGVFDFLRNCLDIDHGGRDIIMTKLGLDKGKILVG